MSRIKSLLFLLVLAAQVPLASATVTYAVGRCKPTLPSFATIQGALDATPAPNVVEVCPGSYPEQILITNPVTLESVPGQAQAVVAAPLGGLVTNTSDDRGDILAAQVLVHFVSGEVNLTNLTIDGAGNEVASPNFIVGVFYQNSPGTVNHVTIQNQNGNGRGVGAWLEGGSANPAVTVENSELKAFDLAGVYVETASSSPEVTATITGNEVGSAAGSGIVLLSGLTASVSTNLISVAAEGIEVEGGTSSVSKNTIGGSFALNNTIAEVSVGIDVETDGASVSSNAIIGAALEGILVNSAVAPVTGNTITQFLSGSGIDFNCTAGSNVHSNTIVGAITGLESVPTAAVTNNRFKFVHTTRAGGCP